MSWLMVAKMPLLMSSRMMSATLTDRRSASSLTVMVPGSSIGPRSRGSATWTCVPTAPSRRGGLRGPRRPRVPLLLLATRSSSDVFSDQAPRRDILQECAWERCFQRPSEGALRDGNGETVPAGANVRAASGESTALVEDDLAGRCAHDPPELTLRPGGPARDACPRRGTTRPSDLDRAASERRYVATSSVAGVAGLAAVALRVVRFGFAAAGLTASGSDPSASAEAAEEAAVGVAAFLLTRFGFAGASSAAVEPATAAVSVAGSSAVGSALAALATLGAAARAGWSAAASFSVFAAAAALASA